MNGRPFDPKQHLQHFNDLPRPNRVIPVKLWFFVAIGLVIFLIFRFGVGLYADYLWFQHLELESVFSTSVWARFLVGVAVGLPVAAVFVANALIARWLSIRNTIFYSEEIVISQRFIGGIIWLLGFVLTWIVGSAASRNWLIFLSYIYQRPFNITDPVFNMDVAFYVFSLPVYNFVQSWIIVALFMALLGSLVVYALAQQRTIAEGRMPVFLPYIQFHLSVLGALIFLTFAWGHWLGLFDLMYSSRGVAFGASYTDINITMPVMWTMIVTAVLAAGLMLANIYLRRPELGLAVVFMWVIAGAIGMGLLPTVVQRYIVEPNELASETPYIENNIKFTNIGYGLNDIVEDDFASPMPLTPEITQANATTLKNIRLWDYRPLRQTYQQIQAIRLYYRFKDIDFDRYIIDGELRQIAISVRELEKEQLQQTWVTQKLQFTHGYGVVANPVNEITQEGLPRLWIQDLPPKSTVDLEINRPEIYYGEMTNDYVFVKTTEREFNYPSGDANVYSEYEGTGGVIMNNYLKQLAFAFYLNDINLLLSQEFTSESRVMLHRNIQERVRHIAPFLHYDNDPYIVIDDAGRLKWIQDAYTFTDLFPYSEPFGDLNYIRNSVKIVIDAYNGDVTFYVIDDKDPIIQTYMGIFPALFAPMGEMPTDLLDNLRYPEDLFRIQSQLYLTYHMKDVNVFYNKEDLWQFPKEILEGNTQSMEPYYVVLSLPDSEEDDEFLLIQPFTPSNKDNMIAWMAARADSEHYGQLVIFRFPKQELIYGPLQIEARVDQNPEISAQISLWNQSGSQVIRGNLLVLPIGGSLLYVEPLYLQAENGEIPELKRVIVASGDRITMANTLADALEKLFTEDGQLLPEPVDEPDVDKPDDTIPPDLVDMDITQLAQIASDHYEAAQRALQQGDWATYGTELEKMEAALKALVLLTNEK
jgi:hypothetical protein